MMSLMSVEGHSDHTQSWIFPVPSEAMPTCVACLVSILEAPDLIPVQKKPALASLANLVQQSSEAVTCLQGNIAITSHCLLTLMELLKLDDPVFVAQVLDVCVKVVGKVKSEELVRLVLDIIQTEVTSNKDCKALCPLYLLLGRLVHNFSSLAVMMGQEFDSLLQQLCSCLTFPDEDLRAAIVYIFVYLLVGDWPTRLSSLIHRQIVQEVVCLLNTAKAQGLLLNCLGLLKKLVTNGDSVELLMKLNLEGVTLLSILKKLLVSKKEVQQISSIQILSGILQVPEGHSSNYTVVILQSDLMEFLFECLHTRNPVQTRHIFQCLQPLCQLEQFYTKCHSVYGMESILRAIEILADMRHYELFEDGLKILAIVLTKQPSNVPLFINAKMVQFCLSIISRGLKQQHPMVFSASLLVLMAIIRKDHLLLPVPFEELEGVIEYCSKNFWTRAKSLEVTVPRHNKPGRKRMGEGQGGCTGETYRDIPTYCQTHLKCVRLLQACINDPKASVSTFSAPCVSDNHRTSVQRFQDFLLNSSAESCIPLVMDELDQTEDADLLGSLSKLICQLYELDTSSMSGVIHRLCVTGVLTRILDIHTQHSVTRTSRSMVADCLLVMCQVLHDRDSPSVHPFPVWTSETLEGIQYRLQDLPRIVSQVSLKIETKTVYLFLLYHAFKNDEMILSGLDLQTVLREICATEIGLEELSPLAKKHYIFLTAMAFCLSADSQDEQDNQITAILSKLLTECSVEELYTHHLAVLRWTCQHQQLSRTCAHKVVEAWLGRLCGPFSQEDRDPGGAEVWLRDHPDVRSLLQLCREKCVVDVLQNLFLTSNEAVLRVTKYILCSFADQVIDPDERTDYLLYLSGRTADSLQQMFLDKGQHEAGLEALLVLHLFCKQQVQNTAVSTSDIKILYHVTKFAGCNTTIPMSLLLTCVQYIQTSVQGPDTASTHRVLSLVIQNEDMLGRLENLCASTNPTLASVAVSVVVQMVHYTSSLSQHQCTRPMKMDFLPISQYLDTDHPALLLTRLDLLCVLFRYHFSSSVLILAHTQRYPPHPECPFTSREIREVYLHLQQLVLQELVEAKTCSVQCIQSILCYLHTVDPTLELHLRTHPWNSLMLEVMLQTYNNPGDEENLHSTILLVQQVLYGKGISSQLVSGQGTHSQLMSGQGPSSKPVSGQGLSSKPVSGQGPSSKPVSGQGSSSKPVSGQGPSSKPVSGQGPSSQLVSGQGPSSQLVSTLLNFLLHQDVTNLSPMIRHNIQDLIKKVMEILSEEVLSKHRDALTALLQCNDQGIT
ncbi:meiosis inhibitor protein 1-like isoform X2 [Mizuhopecten yessoensis]|uniref:Meiosis inhibitor protein 1 n=2 Tax=Mizuhopecten yessoensis TaxID=6573 RepID=A0A210Q4J5_MIZYE|nr:meiosis inhibitor protein 1-like isoform X2 [Mizuhopecten yessoensis]OWF43609.1 Meiosis inhibitor protein 1 [Mizuhopecten yessoensis]